MNFVRKILKIIFVSILGLVIIDLLFVLTFFVKSENIQKADAIIVMGAAINSPALYNRSLEALEIYQKGFAPVVVLSGGRVSEKDISEATYIQRTMQSKAEKPLNLILDEKSTNTWENIQNSKNQIPKAKSVIVVSDTFHLARSVMTAKMLGFEEVFWSSPKTFFPRGELYRYYAREIVANFVYGIRFLNQ